MGDTRDLHAQQIRNLSIVNDARSLGIRTKRAGEAGEQQGVPPDQATPHAPRHLHQPLVPLRSPSKRRKRRRNKDNEDKDNKDNDNEDNDNKDNEDNEDNNDNDNDIEGMNKEDNDNDDRIEGSG